MNVFNATLFAYHIKHLQFHKHIHKKDQELFKQIYQKIAPQIKKDYGVNIKKHDLMVYSHKVFDNEALGFYTMRNNYIHCISINFEEALETKQTVILHELCHFAQNIRKDTNISVTDEQVEERALSHIENIQKQYGLTRSQLKEALLKEQNVYVHG